VQRAHFAPVMVRITFPQVLQRHVRCPPLDVTAATLRDALDAAFAVYPTLRGYLLDDTGALRQHVTVFVDGAVATERVKLSRRLAPDARVDVLQALSGG
jgi:molybdopterin synthase sulfur carrier subunit